MKRFKAMSKFFLSVLFIVFFLAVGFISSWGSEVKRPKNASSTNCLDFEACIGCEDFKGPGRDSVYMSKSLSGPGGERWGFWSSSINEQKLALIVGFARGMVLGLPSSDFGDNDLDAFGSSARCVRSNIKQSVSPISDYPLPFQSSFVISPDSFIGDPFGSSILWDAFRSDNFLVFERIGNDKMLGSAKSWSLFDPETGLLVGWGIVQDKYILSLGTHFQVKDQYSVFYNYDKNIKSVLIGFGVDKSAADNLITKIESVSKNLPIGYSEEIILGNLQGFLSVSQEGRAGFLLVIPKNANKIGKLVGSKFNLILDGTSPVTFKSFAQDPNGSQALLDAFRSDSTLIFENNGSYKADIELKQWVILDTNTGLFLIWRSIKNGDFSLTIATDDRVKDFHATFVSHKSQFIKLFRSLSLDDSRSNELFNKLDRLSSDPSAVNDTTLEYGPLNVDFRINSFGAVGAIVTIPKKVKK